MSSGTTEALKALADFGEDIRYVPWFPFPPCFRVGRIEVMDETAHKLERKGRSIRGIVTHNGKYPRKTGKKI